MGALTHNGEVLQSLPANASQINFDKTGTDLNSTQTENAIKEVNAKANANATDIASLRSNLEKNALVSAVDISSYSDANPYTTTSDGYLYLNNGSGQTARVLIGSAGYASVGGNQGRYSVFVRKGTQLLPSGTADAIRFVPIS